MPDIHVFTSNLPVISNEFWLVHRAVYSIWLVRVFTMIFVWNHRNIICTITDNIAQSDKIRSSRFRCQQETIAWCNLYPIHQTVLMLQRIGCESYARLKVGKRNDITPFSHWNPSDRQALKFNCFCVRYRIGQSCWKQWILAKNKSESFDDLSLLAILSHKPFLELVMDSVRPSNYGRTLESC